VTDGHGVLLGRGRPARPGARDSASTSRRGPSKGDLKERAILATCELLLGEKPLREIGVDELAAGAGISRPSFYFYFESKNAVLRALVERLADEMYAEAESWLQREGDSPDLTISRSIEAAAQQWREHGPVLRAAVQAWGSVPELGAFWEDIVRRFVDQSAARITDERAAGAAPPGPDPEALAKALIWMNERCFYTSSLGTDPSLSEAELVPTLTAIWLRSIFAGLTPPAAG
jgi:TetR/AcrR family transcriptional regulator, ethionamide resistance regulator